MLFDKLAQIAERHFPQQMQDIVSQAALLHIRETWEETYERGVIVTYQDIFDRLFLPFPATCVEDPEGLVLLWWAHRCNEDQPGLHEEDVLSCVVFRWMGKYDAKVDPLRDGKGYAPDKNAKVLQIMQGFVSGFRLVERDYAERHINHPVDDEPERGYIGNFEGGPLIECKTSNLKMGWGDKRNFVVLDSEKEKEVSMLAYASGCNDPIETLRRVRQDYIRAFIVALRQVMLVNHPGNWIVKAKSEERTRRAKKGPAIARSHERARYLLISDEERIRHFRQDQNGEKRKSPTAHARRAHLRKVGVNEETGRKVYTKVKASWIGSREATIDGVRYEVQLDL